MRLRSTIVAVAAAGCLLACGKKDEGEAKAKPGGDPPVAKKGCGRVPDDVATWLTTLELGPVLAAEGSPEARVFAERQNVYETVVTGAGYQAWCRDAAPLAKACLVVSDKADPTCKDPQEALLGLELSKDCPANLAAEAASWLTIKELGPAPAADGQPRTDWKARAKAYLDRIDKATTEKLCADVGGLPVRCMTSREHPDCALLLDAVTASLAPDSTAKPPP